MARYFDTLSNYEAQRLLVRFLQANVDELPVSPSAAAVRELLADAAEPPVRTGKTIPPPAGASVPPLVSDGELARDALLLLAEESEVRARLEYLEAVPSMRSFSVEPNALVLTSALALAVLQLKGVISYDQDRGFQLKLEQRATAESLLGTFIAKVLARFGAG